MTKKAAVLKALEELGGRTSLKMLSDRASQIYGDIVDQVCCGRCRGDWRLENNIKDDCRSYNGQPRRNMQNDNAVSLQQVKRLATFLRKVPANALTTLIGDGPHAFHSMEQMKNAMEEYAYLRAAA